MKSDNIEVVGDTPLYYNKGEAITPNFPLNPEDGWKNICPDVKNIDCLNNSGVFRYTQIEIFLNEKYSENTEILTKELEERSLSIVNKIVNIYRNVVQDYRIDNLSVLEVVDIFFFDENIGLYPYNMNTGGAMINLGRKDINSIFEKISTGYEVPAFELLIDAAKKSFFLKRYKIALIEIFQAFDVYIEEISNIEDISLPERIFYTTKNVLKIGFENKYGDSFEIMFPELYASWNSIYNEKRCGVIHKTYSPNREDVEETFTLITEMIEKVEGLRN